MIHHFILCSFLSFFNPPHDIAMAVFEVTLEENTLQLKIKIDRGDLEEALQLTNDKQNITPLIAHYISKNAIWIVNNKPTSFKFSIIKEDKDFYFLETTPIEFTVPFTSLDIYNTCLIETVDKHSNLIYIKQKGKEMRGFRMNKKRTQISVDL